MAKEYINLLARREGKEVLGKYYSNLWLLTIVLTLTFVSISFSNGSLSYLDEKMNDPFTNWVSIQNNFGDGGKIKKFKQNLLNPEIQARFLFNNVQSDRANMLNLFHANRTKRNTFRTRFFGNMKTDLMNAILSEENVVNGVSLPIDEIINETYGVIMTLDALEKCGYNKDTIPAYISYAASNSNIDSLGLDVIDGYLPIPLPLLAVVKRLPSNIDLIQSNYFYDGAYSNLKTFSFQEKEYMNRLYYFVDKEYEDAFKDNISGLNENGFKVYAYIDERHHIKPWKPGALYKVYINNNEKSSTSLCNTVNKEILKKCDNSRITRVYDYNVPKSKDKINTDASYLSVNFTSLDSIRVFEAFAKDNEVIIDMAQVDSKENFNAVSIMANILSFAMIVFSIVCIIMFIINMLQSYFQKVKRNMGTFKAFGINSSELTNIYVVMLLAIIVTAIAASLCITWFTELLLPIIGVMKDGKFNYLELWSAKTVIAIFIVIIATIVTVRVVMGNLLKQTPGDLIYDR